jgi:hypothetical protein
MESVSGYKPMIIEAPWTPAQVDQLNRWQRSRQFHPFTCGGNRTDEKHLDGKGVLIATTAGWICPCCDYRQNWCHDFMVRDGGKKMLDVYENE